MKTQVEETIAAIRAGLPNSNLLSLIKHPNQSIRGCALQALVETQSQDIIPVIEDFINAPENRKHFMGTVSLSHFALKLLHSIDSVEARESIEGLLKVWPESDREDMEWFLAHG